MSELNRIVNPETGELLDPKDTPDYYTLDAIRHADVWTEENIKAEYTRLRKIVVARLKQISKSELGRASKTWYFNQNKFKPTSQLKPYERKILLAEAAKMIQARTGTLSGIKRYRDLAVKTFQEHGYEFVTKENFLDVGEFFREWKDSKYRGYGSMVALDFYEQISNSEAVDRATQKTNKRAEVLRDFIKWKEERDTPHQKQQNDKEKSSAGLLRDLDEFLW
jgi:hypothetical protein